MKTLLQSSRHKTALTVLLLTAAALLACAPFLGGGLYHGSDLGYHLRRIENIAIGLTNGQFPVRIQSDWCGGAGYAVGVFYGDLLLYPAALLRLAGLSVSAAYGLYLFAVTLLTGLFAFYAARRLGAGRTGAAAGAVLYLLSTYRLCNTTVRAALGEYTALAFLPLVACGLWRTLQPDDRRLPGWLLLTLGLSGVLQSHLLSFEMTVLLLALAALLLARRTFRPAALRRLLAAAATFCALNAGFLVPFLQYYLTEKFQINQPGGTEPIQSNGALWQQLLGLPFTASGGEQAGLVPDMPLTPGPALLLAVPLVLAVVLAFRRSRAALPLAAAGVGCLLLAGNFFPWDALYSLGSTAARLVGSLQFPWRFLGPATLFLSLAAALALSGLPQRPRIALAVLLCAVSVFSAAGQLREYCRTAAPEHYLAGTEEPFWEAGCGHYLPAEQGPTDLSTFPEGPIWDGGITLGEYRKNGIEIRMTVANNAGEPAGVLLPLLWYRGYTAVDDATGDTLPVSCGMDNAVDLTLPDGYAGTVTVTFREPPLWRAAELVSLLTLLGGALLLRRRAQT